IFDEPTRGIDINSRSEIYFFIRELAKKGTACIVISSDLEELIGLCPEIAVMREGRIAGILDTEEKINEKEIMYLATGVK
ncbi:MAG: sugar ABC transporter ATP-binding protein, partial [Lentisphaeria bacterium]|nr:sugar ABC transporter ATP-binding protein [Lentisphaeria bacterium]